MEFRQLECFCAAGELEHFSNAAERLHITQPALSGSIRSLEQELDVTLFIRDGKRVHLSSQGRALLPQAQRILAERDSFLVQAGHGQQTAVVRFAVTAASELLPGIINGFRRAHPGVELILLQTEQEADAADLYLEVTMEARYTSKETTLTGEEIMLAVPVTDKLSQQETISLQSLSDVPLISLRPGHHMRGLEDHYFRRAGITPHRTVECDSPATLRQLIRLGLGIAMVPSLSWRSAESPEVRFIPISWPQCRRFLSIRVERNDPAVFLLRDYLVQFFKTTGAATDEPLEA